MKITDIHVGDFGAWHDLKLNDLSSGATVFYGPNEAGKTTLLNFVRNVLYGYSPKRCQRYLPPARGTRAGGELHVAAPHGRYVLERFADARYAGGTGELAIRTPDGKRQGNHLLQSLLGGVDETIFNNVFAVGLTQLQQLGSLSDTEAAQQLYGLATGSDRVSLFQVVRSLKEQQSAILANDPSKPGEIDRLCERRQRLEQEMQSLRDENRRWFELLTDQEKLRREIEQLETAQQQVGKNGNWHDVAGQLRDKWARGTEIHHQLLNIGPLPDIPAHIQKRVHELTQHVQQQRKQWESLRKERQTLKRQAAEESYNAGLWQHASEIEALDRQRNRAVSLQAEVDRGRKVIEQLDFELQAEVAQLGLQAGTSQTGIASLSITAVEGLRPAARETQQLAARVDAAKKVQEAYQSQLRELQGELDSARVRFGGEDVVAGLERSEKATTLLRRRVELDDQREQLSREIDDHEEQMQFWLRRQVLPWNGVLTVCAIFSVGAMVFFTGLCGKWFSIADANSWMMMLVGGTTAVLSLILKRGFESTAADRADELQESLEQLNAQRAETLVEVEKLQRDLPSGSGNLVQRLKAAEEQYGQLKQVAPLARRKRTLTDEAAAAERQVTTMVDQLKDARRRWKSALITAGLPDSLLPEQIENITEHVGRTSIMRQRLQETKRDFEVREQELTLLQQRIDYLMGVGEILDARPTIEAQLDALLAKLREHTRASEIRADLRRRWDEQGRQQKRIAEAAARQMSMRRALLTNNGVKNVAEFDATRKKAESAAAMREERKRLLQEIAEILGELAPKNLDTLLEHDPREEFQACLERIGVQLSEGESRLRTLHERFGQMKQKVDNLTTDRVLARKQLELNMIDEEIDRLLQQWNVTALANLTLDDVRKTYERDRQPETLSEASAYLERLTEGRYTRVWTPFGESSLCIDDDKQQVHTVDKLSRGTREQVFLALRLALVTAYNRRGAAMPMVLDDVFVNFDNHRAQAAAEVLYDVTRAGHQLLVFTCHEHIKDIFHDLGGDVRDLPLRDGIQSRRVRANALAPATPDASDRTEIAHGESTHANHGQAILATADASSPKMLLAQDAELPAYVAEEEPLHDDATLHAVQIASELDRRNRRTDTIENQVPEPQASQRAALTDAPAPTAVEFHDPWLDDLPPLDEWGPEPDRVSVVDEADELLYRL